MVFEAKQYKWHIIYYATCRPLYILENITLNNRKLLYDIILSNYEIRKPKKQLFYHFVRSEIVIGKSFDV